MERKLKNIALTVITSILMVACGHREIKFDAQKWTKEIDGFYEYRENMVNDLIENHLNKGMTYTEMTNLIGEPEKYGEPEKNIVAYGIMEDYGWDIDPVETKVLFIEFTNDSLIKNIEIKHWKK